MKAGADKIANPVQTVDQHNTLACRNGCSRTSNARREGFTLVELMVVVAITGILSAVAIPAFIAHARSAKTTEATLGIDRMFQGGVAYFNTEHTNRGGAHTLLYALPKGTIGYTPNKLPDAGPGNRYTIQEWYKHTGKNNNKARTMKALDFDMADDFYYAYRFTNEHCRGKTCVTQVGKEVYFEARGDLDGDEEYSYFSRAAEIGRDADGNYGLWGATGIYTEHPDE